MVRGRSCALRDWATAGEATTPASAASAVMQASSLALQQALKEALADPDFPPEGRSLGFACEHLYAHSSLGFHPPEHLKGRDAMLLAAAKSLGLTAEVVPVMCDEYYSDEVRGPQHDDFLTGFASEMDFRISYGDVEEMRPVDYMRTDLLGYNAGELCNGPVV